MGIPLGVIGSVVAANAAPASGDPHWDNVVMLANFTTGPWNSGNVDKAGKTTSAAALNGGTYTLVNTTPVSANHGQYISKANAFGGYRLDPTNQADWSWPGEFTVEWWMNASAFNAAGDNGIFVKQNLGSGFQIPLQIAYSGTGSIMRFTIGNGTASYNLDATIPKATLTGSWHHIAYTRDSSNITRVFLDGVMNVKSGTAQPGTTYQNTDPVVFFCYGGIRLNGWSGSLDDVRVTKGVARYNSDAGFSVPTEPFWYPGIDD